MALQTRVLVSSIHNLSDARYCAGMGVDLIGFDLTDESENYVNPATFKAITDWVSGVKFVGELPEADAAKAQELLKEYALDFLQVSFTPDWASLAGLGIPLICKVYLDAPDFTFESFNQIYGPVRQYVKWFVLESPVAELSFPILQIVNQIAARFPVLLGFGIDADSIKSLLAQSAIQGIVLKGSHEIRPGFKDYNDLADILEALESEE